VSQKAKESEQSMLEVPPSVYRVFVEIFESLDDGVLLNSDTAVAISNKGFRTFLAHR
jgi:hypothetical protein